MNWFRLQTPHYRNPFGQVGHAKGTVEKIWVCVRASRRVSLWRTAVRTIKTTVWKSLHILAAHSVGQTLLYLKQPSIKLLTWYAGKTFSHTVYMFLFNFISSFAVAPYSNSSKCLIHFIISDLTMRPTLLDIWMRTAEAIASPHCSIRRAGSLWTSPQIMAPHSIELDHGFQVLFYLIETLIKTLNRKLYC